MIGELYGVDCSCSYCLITLDSTDISTSGKNKAPASVNGAEAFIKEQLAVEIQRLSTANTQLISDKIETEKIKINLEADKVRLFGEKNFLIVKREELQAEIVALNAIGSSNISVRGYQDLLVNQSRDKLKVRISNVSRLEPPEMAAALSHGVAHHR